MNEHKATEIAFKNGYKKAAKEIFEEIEQKIERDIKFYKSVYDECGNRHIGVKNRAYGKMLAIGPIRDFIIELKKKYTEDRT